MALALAAVPPAGGVTIPSAGVPAPDLGRAGAATAAFDEPLVGDFLAALPGDLRHALEPRHPSFADHRARDLLKRYDVATVRVRGQPDLARRVDLAEGRPRQGRPDDRERADPGDDPV